MAGEYSRGLSVKSFAGMERVFKLGFRLGAAAPYGIRRLLVDQNGIPKILLRHGQRKSIQTDRIILVPGPPEEIKMVRWIFSTFVKKRKTEKQIVEMLNARGVESGLGRPWSYHRVRKMLRREIYIGFDVWNRTSTKSDKAPSPTHPKNGCARDAASNRLSTLGCSRALRRSFASAECPSPTNRSSNR